MIAVEVESLSGDIVGFVAIVMGIVMFAFVMMEDKHKKRHEDSDASDDGTNISG